MTITFTVPAIPIAQPRQRHAVRGGFAVNYTPQNHPVNAFKAAVQMAARIAYQGPPLDEPLRMDLCIVFPRPMKVLKRDGIGRLWHTGKPDRDNLEKGIQDSLNGLTYRDDSLICAGSTVKYRAAAHEQPHVQVTISTLEQP